MSALDLEAARSLLAASSKDLLALAGRVQRSLHNAESGGGVGVAELEDVARRVRRLLGLADGMQAEIGLPRKSQAAPKTEERATR